MFGKNKIRLEVARQVIAKLHETIQPYPDDEIAEALDFAEIVRFDMAVSETAREAEGLIDLSFDRCGPRIFSSTADRAMLCRQESALTRGNS
jgi:hypothetical protein